MTELTAHRRREVLSYDPDTGAFAWKDSRCSAVSVGAPAGCVDSTTGYVKIGVDRRRYKAHALAILYVTGRWPGMVDHINGDRADNRITNLREVSARENTRNQRLRINSRSGVKGITWDGARGAWLARVNANGVAHNVGRFKTLEEASEAVRLARARLHGEFTNHG